MFSIIDLTNQSNKPAAVYLARQKDGIKAFQRFVTSYQSVAAGVEHDLIVIFKGFDSKHDLEQAKQLFKSIPIIPVELPDLGYDIGVYLKVVSMTSYRYYCFLNTHTQILAPNWLGLLYQAILRDDVGIAGAMGSYESLQTSIRLISKVVNSCKNYLIPFDEVIDGYYGFLTKPRCHRWRRGKVTQWMRVQRAFQRGLYRLTALVRTKTSPLERAMIFPDFPNPHLRSNGFIVHRDWMLDSIWHPIVTKQDACLFESGTDGITSRVLAKGKRCVVVDKHGSLFDLPQWWKSRTFRIANQEDLILSDNQSRGYLELDERSKFTYSRMTWGDYLGEAPEDFPTFDCSFPVNPSRIR